MGRISVELSDELEKKLRFKTIERFGGRKGDLSRAVGEAIKTWVAKEKQKIYAKPNAGRFLKKSLIAKAIQIANTPEDQDNQG